MESAIGLIEVEKQSPRGAHEDGQYEVLASLNLSVQEGEFSCLLGLTNEKRGPSRFFDDMPRPDCQ